MRLRASDLAKAYSTVQGGRPVRVQRSHLDGEASPCRVRQSLLQDRRADAAILELGQHHQLAQVDEVRTVLSADIPGWHAITFDNLMGDGVPTAPKVSVLCSRISHSGLPLDDLSIGKMVHVAREFGISRCCRPSALQPHTGMMPYRRQSEHRHCWRYTTSRRGKAGTAMTWRGQRR